MKLSAHDEYGMRLLVRVAREGGTDSEGLTTAVLAEREGITMSHAGKVLRLLRRGGFVESRRGNTGGYTLAKRADEIRLDEVLAALGGRLFDDGFCAAHSAGERLCTNSVDCSVRSLWRMVQFNVDELLRGLTLVDLIGTEAETALVLGERPSTSRGPISADPGGPARGTISPSS